MAQRGRKKTQRSVSNPRGESATARKTRAAQEKKGYGSRGPCFIATAVYGDPWSPEGDALRRFRDRHLMPHRWGRLGVHAYYRMSPPIANWLRRHPRIARLARIPLDRLARRY